ncbi:MAG: hypothetical protein IPN50_08525 [Sphingomonadales bacterium]|nr:hypothetical protein [Sphingomonadales bacterium]
MKKAIILPLLICGVHSMVVAQVTANPRTIKMAPIPANQNTANTASGADRNADMIRELQLQIDQLRADLTAVSTKASSLQTQVKQQETKLSGLQNDNLSLKSELQKAKGDLAKSNSELLTFRIEYADHNHRARLATMNGNNQVLSMPSSLPPNQYCKEKPKDQIVGGIPKHPSDYVCENPYKPK